MLRRLERENRLILTFALGFFLIFLAIPLILIVFQSLRTDSGIGPGNYIGVLTQNSFFRAFGNSLWVSLCSGALSMALAFLLAYTVNCTNLSVRLKKLITVATGLPMLLPTITYGFAIIYTYDRQGLIFRLFGGYHPQIYGFNGMVFGYVVYTLPISFMLIDNGFRYIDKQFILVCRLMGDRPLRAFFTAILSPLAGTLGTALIQSFSLSFTDFGIPASVGGQYNVVATVLYDQMLGSVPDFGKGSAVAIFMLIPSAASIFLLNRLGRYSFRYSRISEIEFKKAPIKDFICAVCSVFILLAVLSIFLVIFIVPFVTMWPYRLTFTFSHIAAVFEAPDLCGVYLNSLFVSAMTALFGTLLAYAAALVTARSRIPEKWLKSVDGIALVTNTVPGMVLGISFLLAFSGTPLHNTFLLIILCNIIHYFSSPYFMIKETLAKLNSSWEPTAKLMGDSWLKTVRRVLIPNTVPTILDVFGYYFINAMVTISAVVFLTGAFTMVITTKIQYLQHVGDFDEIFALSVLIFLTNLTVKLAVKTSSDFIRKKRG